MDDLGKSELRTERPGTFSRAERREPFTKVVRAPALEARVGLLLAPVDKALHSY